MLVLVVDDDDALRSAIARTFELEGFDVETAADGVQAVARFSGDADFLPDVVVLDVLMPNLDGLAACRLIRRQSAVPILMLTARDEVGSRVVGLDAGADDYLGKPFAVTELLARVRALVRRTASPTDVLRYGDLEVNLEERRAYRDGRLLSLTRIEFALLELFLLQPRKALHRHEIIRRVWGTEPDSSTSNSLDVFISSIRRKLEADARPRIIHTVRGIGYALREDP
ncbi:MAG TPA: response regulator transcription factor [Gaiellaceae bacterium]